MKLNSSFLCSVVLVPLLLALAGCWGAPDSEPASKPSSPAARPVSKPGAPAPSASKRPAAPTDADYAARDAATRPAVPAPDLQAPQSPKGPHLGMWVWHEDAVATESGRRQLLDFCRKEGIRRLLVQIHYQTDPSTGQPRIRHSEALAALLAEASSSGIVVEALDGDPSWALTSRNTTYWPKLDAVLAWNANQPANARFVGVHLDVEPYVLEEFKNDQKPRLLREYLEFLSEVRRRVSQQNPPMTLAADIPFWFDKEDLAVEFAGKRQPVGRHAQDICDYVAVMSYRQKGVGANSIVSTSSEEIDYAERIGKKAFPSVEMSPISDTPTISFFGTEPAYFQEQMKLVGGALQGRKGFAGVMIHHYKSYQAYLETAR